MTGDQSSGHCGRRQLLRISLGRVPLAPWVAAAAFALIAAHASTSAMAQGDDGATIFSSKCSACHTIGKGKTVGPDLKGITSSEDPSWLARWIASPSALIKAGDPKATRLVKQYPLQMPDLGLSSTDITAVLAYISAQSGGAAATKGTAAAPVAALPPGDAASGREYFVGGKRLKNGGPPCMSCHSISGIGALGGGTLGPDLTDAYRKYGGDAGPRVVPGQRADPDHERGMDEKSVDAARDCRPGRVRQGGRDRRTTARRDRKAGRDSISRACDPHRDRRVLLASPVARCSYPVGPTRQRNIQS